MRRRPASPAAARLAAALLAVTGAAAAAERAPRRGEALPAPPAPSAELPAGGGTVVLAAPGTERVYFPPSFFIMGSGQAELSAVLALCTREVRAGQCDLPTGFFPRPGPALSLEGLVELELVAHPVSLSGFWLDRREVSVADYRRCVEAGPCSMPPPYANGGERFERPDYPIALVTWSDADTYCRWRGGRLPTEAEWERAARGTPGRRFPWGNQYHRLRSNHGGLFVSLPDRALPGGPQRQLQGREDQTDGFLELAPVGSFLGGRTPEGLDDMAGNVAEWVSDYFEERYEPQPVHNPKGPAANGAALRVARGGGYVHGAPLLRTTARLVLFPTERQPWLGFRCAQDGAP
jgi:formylglycine-generating enzyme required for sulfatase activity